MIAFYLILIIRDDINSQRKLIKNIPPFSTLIQKRLNVEKRAKAELINHFMPSFTYLQWYISKQNQDLTSNQDKLLLYSNYYEKIVESVPSAIEGLSILGFCRYHQGKISESIHFYKEILKYNPVSFWPYYNLGVIYFKNNEWEQAIINLSKALKQKPMYTIKEAESSKLYRQIFNDPETLKSVSANHLQKSYVYTWKMIILSLYNLGQYNQMLNFSGTAIQSNNESKELFKFYEALSFYQLNELSKAESSFKELIKYDSLSEISSYYLKLINNSKISNTAAMENFSKELTPPFNTSEIRLEIF